MADLVVSPHCDLHVALSGLPKLRMRVQQREDNVFLYEGRGPTVIIAPWNFPLAILTGMATAALAAGNTVILKPAEQSSAIAYQLYERMISVGFA